MPKLKLQPTEIVATMGLMDSYIKWKNKNGKPRNYQVFHPSAFGSCLRKMQYQRYEEEGKMEIHSDKDDPKASMIRLWGNGHFIQAKWTEYFEELGLLRGIWKCTNAACGAFKDNGDIDLNKLQEAYDGKIRPREYGHAERQGVLKPKKCACGCKKFVYDEKPVVCKELNFYGHADLILDFRNLNTELVEKLEKTFKIDDLPKGVVVADMKTINDFGWKKLEEPSLTYQVQMQIYANVLDCDYGILIYENKNNSDARAFKIQKGEETVWPTVQKQSLIMQKMHEQGKLPPPRPLNKKEYQCKYCEFRGDCHASDIWQNENLVELRKKFYGNLL